jgi:hypothetical protein
MTRDFGWVVTGEWSDHPTFIHYYLRIYYLQSPLRLERTNQSTKQMLQCRTTEQLNKPQKVKKNNK